MKVIAFPKLRQEEPVVEEAPTDVSAPVGATLGGSDEGGGIDRITVRVITVALALSLFIHVLLLVVPLMKNESPKSPPADQRGPLTARLEEQAPATRSPPQPQPRTPEPPPTKSIQQPKPSPTPPRSRLTVPSRQPKFTVPPAPETPAPVTAPTPEVVQAPQQPPAVDMQSYIEARRRARGAPPESQGETDDERAKRIALGNIQAQQRAASPETIDGGGGLFQLDRTGLNDADFVFKGWSTDFKRNVGLTVHVTKGDAPDIKLAVVRKMIGIIRERKNGDFEWYSYKRGKSITMSARPGDTDRLELFLMHEFYPEDPRGRDVR